MNENFFASSQPSPQTQSMNEKNPLENIIFQKMLQSLQSVDAGVERGREYYKGGEVESIFFGNRSDGAYTQRTKDDLSREVKSGRVSSSHVESYHNQTKVRLNRQDAFNMALGKYESRSGEVSLPEKKVYADQGVLLYLLNMSLKTRPSDKEKLSAITTVDTSVDIDYGADALVYSASTDSERQDTINGKRPVVSLGITTVRKDLKKIRSNIEIYMPDNKSFIQGFLDKPQELMYIVKNVFIAVQNTFDEKMSGAWINELEWEKTHKPLMIDCADLLEKKRNNAHLH